MGYARGAWLLGLQRVDELRELTNRQLSLHCDVVHLRLLCMHLSDFVILHGQGFLDALEEWVVYAKARGLL